MENSLLLMQDYLDLKGASPKTKEAYLSALKCLSVHFNSDPAQLGQEEIKSFLLYLINIKKRSSATIRCYFYALKLFYTDVINKKEVIISIPNYSRNNKKLPIILSKSEVHKLLAVTKNLKHLAILSLLYSAGLRISEVANLKIKDIDSARMVINVHNGKGSKDRQTILSTKALETLRTYFKIYRPSIWLFPGRTNAYPLATRTIQHAFKIAIKKANIIKPVSPHSLRHSFATHLIEDGISILLIKQLLGHSSLKSTLIYLHTSKPNISAVKSPLDT